MSPTKTDDLVLPLPRAFLRIGVTGHRIGAKFSDATAADARKTVERLLADMARLTRDAVFAWMNLLQSPAIVTISR